MNNKILVNLYVPIINKEYNLFIPVGKDIKTITDLIVKSITDLTNISNINNFNMVICDGITGQIIDPNLIIKNSSLRHGSKIILI